MDKPANHTSPFEAIKKINEYGTEYWSARALGEILEYADFRNMEMVIRRAKKACENSGHSVSDHFGDITKMVFIGSDTKRKIKDFKLSRYACYLVIQNADPSKPMVALGQSYFAVQTRKQEIAELEMEEKRRLFLREEMKKHNTMLADAARGAGIIEPMDYAIFQNHDYQGLYGGLGQREIHKIKGLKKSQKILDHMGSTELAANLFRATQTEEKIRRENIKGKNKANWTHYEVGAKVRQTIKELGGTMPEELPVAEDIKKVEKKHNKLYAKKKELE